MDHASVLALIEHKWNLPPMTKRDAAAWPMLDMFDISARRLGRLDLPLPPSIDQTTAACKADGKNPPTPESSAVPSP
jgi:phospholipase C